ncbi:hypothetical protein RR46_02356 [Papilio xuthus]|uniref:Uncharacterized protein n=1 Tax=Papilio xuthus TaxID=66420 RepID=A0A194Q2B5_PAPXU|nr:hypothetical protein RR46_02356 [Papilio xuthus]
MSSVTLILIAIALGQAVDGIFIKRQYPNYELEYLNSSAEESEPTSDPCAQCRLDSPYGNGQHVRSVDEGNMRRSELLRLVENEPMLRALLYNARS